jgi:hypothetical protein
MRPFALLAGVLLTASVSAGVEASAQTAPATSTVDVTFDQSQVTTVVGDRFTLRSRIANAGAAATDPLIAHLNVASLTSDVYVDPEDWSSSRSRELAPLPAGETTTVSWEIQAVNAGTFDVYVVLLPVGATSAGRGPLVVSPPVHVSVAGRQTLTAGGVLPVVIVVPVLIALVGATARRRARQH